MTVHMFRCFIGIGPMDPNDLETRVNNWLASHTEWDNDPVEHTLTERNTEMDGTGEVYHGIDVRFIQTDTKANIQQKLADKIKDKVEWYRIGYHSCTHDNTDPHSCSWDASTEWVSKNGSIPAAIPNMDPNP